MLFAESQLREGIKAPAILWRRLIRGRTSDLRAAINPERWKSELPNPGNLLQRSWTNVLLICSCIYSCCPESSNFTPIHLKWPCPYRVATKLKPVCKPKCCIGIFPVACVLKPLCITDPRSLQVTDISGCVKCLLPPTVHCSLSHQLLHHYWTYTLMGGTTEHSRGAGVWHSPKGKISAAHRIKKKWSFNTQTKAKVSIEHFVLKAGYN